MKQISQAKEKEIKFKNCYIQWEKMLHSYDASKYNLKFILQVTFYIVGRYTVECITRPFELHAGHEATLSFSYNFHKLQMSKETLKCYCMNLNPKLNSDL